MKQTRIKYQIIAKIVLITDVKYLKEFTADSSEYFPNEYFSDYL